MRFVTFIIATFLYLSTQALAGPLEEAQACGDVHTEMSLLQPLADQGNSQAQFRLGQMYANGEGVTENLHEALKWLTKAADQGNIEAEKLLGGMHSRRLPKDVDDGGIPQDYSIALKWYRKAAEQGDADAERRIGGMYEYGDGVKADNAEAAKWYLRAAQHGDWVAQVYIGRMYESGKGVKQNLVQAYRWMLLGHKKIITETDTEELARISKKLTSDQIEEAKRLAAAANIKTTPPKPEWLASNIVGLSMELDDPEGLENMDFRDDGEVIADIGTKHGPMAAPIFEWRIHGRNLEILDDDNTVFEKLSVISRDERKITACNKSHKLVSFKISQKPNVVLH